MAGTLLAERRVQRKTSRELVIDNFAGGGGASTGIGWAIGRDPDYAINHDAAALAMHRANHPETVHLCEDVWAVDPRTVAGGAPVGLAWFSPDCRHFSRAKGSKPVEKRIRGLAWVAVKWAKLVKPRVIILENVREFEDWGPLLANGRPNDAKRGLTFKRFTGYLRGRGYKVEHRVLDAADYGAPTHRRRLFLVARCDGRPIVFPAPTHGPKANTQLFGAKLKPWRVAAECIDWHLPSRSIFERERPLADKTLRRIAMGLWRYVLDCPAPFIVRVDHGGSHFRGQSVDEPLSTVTAKHGFGLAIPCIVSGYGERAGQQPRARGVDRPAPGVVATGKHALVTAFVNRFFGGVVGKDVRNPLPTVTSIDHHALVACYLARFNHGEKQWNDAREPLGTITSQGNKFGLVAAFLTKYFGTGRPASVGTPLGTVTSRDRFALVQVQLEKGAPVENAVALDVPGEGLCLMADIHLRMFTPRELARCQGFPDSYVFTDKSKCDQVARIGNSVPPQLAEAMARANYVGAV